MSNADNRAWNCCRCDKPARGFCCICLRPVCSKDAYPLKAAGRQPWDRPQRQMCRADCRPPIVRGEYAGRMYA